MTADPLILIPETRREAARAAVADVLDKERLLAVEPVLGGASGASIYRLETAARPYLLRLEPRERLGLDDAARGFACLQAAAAAGIAPPLMHADPVSGVTVMDFVRTRPLNSHPGGPAGLARAAGALAARLHETTPSFPPARESYIAVVERMLGALARPGLVPPGVLDAHLEGFARIKAAYAWGADAPVPSHNDPNPRNLLYDGQRLWLVDWELAFQNDPLVDLAVMTLETAPTPVLEAILFEAALGRAPDRRERARLALMRQLTRLFYAGLLLGPALRGGPESKLDLAAMSVPEFKAAVAAGRLAPGDFRLALGAMVLSDYRASLDAPDFDETLVAAAG